MKKVFILSTILVLVFNAGNYFISAWETKDKKEEKHTKNKEIFKSNNTSSIGTSGVAISTNIGLRYSRTKELPVSIYKEVMSIEQVIANKKEAKTELIGKHMITLEEYRNVLKTDIRNILGKTYNKRAVLDAFIDQLEFRYSIGAKNQNNLLKQRNLLEQAMKDSESQIEALKQKIETDFKNNDDKASLENIDQYLKLKRKFYNARTYIIYINQFLVEYNYLNDFNKKFINLLKTNKEPIIKNNYVIIPNESGLGGLKSMNLIFTEDEIKSK